MLHPRSYLLPIRILCTLIFISFSALSLKAASFSFTGNYIQDDNLAIFTFQVEQGTTVTLLSLGYAGGVNAAGQTISRGGFDPVISVFDGVAQTSLILDINDDVPGCSAALMDAVTGQCLDSALTLISLDAGDYTVVLSQGGNFPGSILSDSYSQQAQGNFTGPFYLGTPGSFIDYTQDQRTSAWAIDIVNVKSASFLQNDVVTVPEPSTFLIAAGGLLGLLRRRKLS